MFCDAELLLTQTLNQDPEINNVFLVLIKTDLHQPSEKKQHRINSTFPSNDNSLPNNSAETIFMYIHKYNSIESMHQQGDVATQAQQIDG